MMMRKTILVLALLLTSAACFGQGAAYTFTVQSPLGIGLPGVSITTCNINTQTAPCSGNLVTTYTDVTLGTPCTISAGGSGQTSGTSCTNSGVSGANGNTTIFVAAGTYYIQIYGGNTSGVTVWPITIQGGTGAVASVFGRTGVVVAAANDYNFNQLAGTCTLAQGCTGLTSSGVVGNYLRSTGAVWASSAIQSADLPATIAANTTGTSSNVTGTVAVANGGTGVTSSGAAGKYLRSTGAAWASASLAFADMTGQLPIANTPLTTRGDSMTVNAGGALTRLALGSNGQCLQSNGSDLVFGSCTNAGNVGDSQLSTNVVFKDEQLAGRANENVTFGHTAAPSGFTWTMNAGTGGPTVTIKGNDTNVGADTGTSMFIAGGSGNTASSVGGSSQLRGGQCFGASCTSGQTAMISDTCTGNPCNTGNVSMQSSNPTGTGTGGLLQFSPGQSSTSGKSGGLLIFGATTNILPPVSPAAGDDMLGVANTRLMISEGTGNAASAYHYIGSNVVNNCPFQGPQGILTGNGTDQTFATCTIKANQMLPGKGIRVTLQWVHTGANAVTYKFNFGGVQFLNYSDNGTAATTVVFEIMNNPGVQNQQSIICHPLIDGTTIVGGCNTLTSAIDTTLDEVFSATFNVANPDTVKLGAQLEELVN